MRRTRLSLLLAVIIFLSTTFILQSCSTVNLNKNTSYNNSAVARLYIGLSSNKLKREFEIADVEKIIASHFNAATLQESIGFYKGEREKSLIITIINCCRWEEPNKIFQEKINKLVVQLQQDLGQESILVEHISQGDARAFEVFE